MEKNKNFIYNTNMKNKKEIKAIAKKIAKLENKCHTDFNNQNIYIKKIEHLIQDLSLEELLAIDIYILENNLLKQ